MTQGAGRICRRTRDARRFIHIPGVSACDHQLPVRELRTEGQLRSGQNCEARLRSMADRVFPFAFFQRNRCHPEVCSCTGGGSQEGQKISRRSAPKELHSKPARGPLHFARVPTEPKPTPGRLVRFCGGRSSCFLSRTGGLSYPFRRDSCDARTDAGGRTGE